MLFSSRRLIGALLGLDCPSDTQLGNAILDLQAAYARLALALTDCEATIAKYKWQQGGPEALPPKGEAFVVKYGGGLEPATYQAFATDEYLEFEKWLAKYRDHWTGWLWMVLP